MPFPKLKFKPVFYILLGFVFILLLSLFFLLVEVLVPKQISRYIQQISKDRGYGIRIKDIEFDLLSGIKGSGLEVSETVDLLNPVLTVRKLVLEPEIFSSLVNWKISVREIVIDEPTFTLSRDTLRILTRLMGREGGKRKGKEAFNLPVVVKYVEVNNARVEFIPGVFLVFRKIRFEFVDAEKEEERELRVLGSVSLKNAEFKFKGVVKPFLDSPVGSFQVSSTGLELKGFNSIFGNHLGLVLSSELDFEVLDGIKLSGKLFFSPLGVAGNMERLPEGYLNYSVKYTGLDDSIYLDRIYVDIGKSFALELTGRVENVTTDRSFDITGRINSIDMGSLSSFVFGSTSSIKLYGGIKDGDIEIKGSLSQRDLNASGNIAFGDIGVREGVYSLEVEEPRASIYLKSDFKGLSAYTELRSQGVLVNSGELRLKDAEIVSEVRTDFGSDTRVDVLSLKGYLGGGTVSGKAQFRALNSRRFFKVLLTGRDIGIGELLGGFYSVPIYGSVESVNLMVVSEEMKRFRAEVSFDIREAGLEFSDSKKRIKIGRLRSQKPVEVVLIPYPNSTDPGDYGSRKDTLRVNLTGKDVYYEFLSFGELLSIKRGNIADAVFKTEGDGWRFSVYLGGSKLLFANEMVSVEEFKSKLVGKPGDQGVEVTGNWNSKGGAMGSFLLSYSSGTFYIDSSLIRLGGVKVRLKELGEVRVGNIEVAFKDNGKGIYVLEFANGNFYGFKRVGFFDVRGSGNIFLIDKGVSLDSRLFVGRLEVGNQTLRDVDLGVVLSRGKNLKVKLISAGFLDGNVSGEVTVDGFSSVFLSIGFEKVFIPIGLGGKQAYLKKLGFEFTGNLKDGSFIPQGRGSVFVSEMGIWGIEGFSVNGYADLKTLGETVFLINGFVEDKVGNRVNLAVLFRREDEKRGGVLKIEILRTPLTELKDMFYPLLPIFLRKASLTGEMEANLELSGFLGPKRSSISGRVLVNNASFRVPFHGAFLSLEGIDGILHVEDKVTQITAIPNLVSGNGVDKKAFNVITENRKQDRMVKDIIRIKELKYGFLSVEDICGEIGFGQGGLSIRNLKAKLYKGHMFGDGSIYFEDGRYGIMALFKEVSLKNITDSIPSLKDYITGRINGFLWLNGRGRELRSINSLFYFWSVKSKDEERKIGKALLKQLGVREKIFLRSFRKYDRGELYGYVREGKITFKKLDISHSIFGIRDLSIKVDEKKNSISVPHFLSVIRETARRAVKGELRFEFKK
ncbi:MAG: hypothetical protein KatS3mg078_0572 [Deltaproteobacteria bacterium]|nr:MAG: hypothetical protein KatS3mg078_0572 [Deltaproteobacteria bacterium]